MPVILWIGANLRVIAIGSTIIVVFFAGWHAHGWVYASALQKATEAKLEAANKGTAEIIDFNQKWSGVNAQDDCINRDMPDSLIRLLK